MSKRRSDVFDGGMTLKPNEADIDAFIQGADKPKLVENVVSKAPKVEDMAEKPPSSERPPLAIQSRLLRKARGQGPGIKKGARRPWLDTSEGPSVRMTLVLTPRQKAQLDYLSSVTQRPAQGFLRDYIVDNLEEDAEELFAMVHGEGA